MFVVKADIDKTDELDELVGRLRNFGFFKHDVSSLLPVVSGSSFTIDCVPDVEIVQSLPLNPLCDWLAGLNNADPPYTFDDLHEMTLTDTADRAKLWRRAIKRCLLDKR